VKSFGEPNNVGMSNCLVGAMWPNWRCSHMSGGSCALCYSCRDFQYPELLVTFWGWLMGPHSGLSLRGGTGYPAPHWNLELGRPRLQQHHSMLTYKVKKVKSPIDNSTSQTFDLSMTVRHVTTRLPSHAYVLVTYLLSYLDTYIFTRLLTKK